MINVVLHFGTMLATIVVFKAEIWNIFKELFSGSLLKVRSVQDLRNNSNLWLIVLICLGSIPTALIGLLFRDFFKTFGDNLLFVAIAFAVTGAILFSTRYIRKETKKDYSDITVWDSLFIGFIQGIAITPGISRSGITISGGLWRSINRAKMGHFSFLLSLPAIFGATVLELSYVSFGDFLNMPVLLGFLLAFAVGYISLKVLLGFVNRGKLQYFSYYCWFIAMVTVMISIYT